MSSLDYASAAAERIDALNSSVQIVYGLLQQGTTTEDAPAGGWGGVKLGFLDDTDWAYSAIETQRNRIFALNGNRPSDAVAWTSWVTEADSVGRELSSIMDKLEPRTASDYFKAAKEALTSAAGGSPLTDIKDTAKWGAVAVIAVLALVVFWKVS